MDRYRILKVIPGMDKEVADALGHTALYFTYPGTDRPLFPGYIFHHEKAPRPYQLKGAVGYMTSRDEYIHIGVDKLYAVHEYLKQKFSSDFNPLTEYLGPAITEMLASSYQTFAPPIGTIEFQDIVNVQRFGKVMGAPQKVARPTFIEALELHRRRLH